MAGRLSQDRFSRFAPSDTLSAHRKKGKNGGHAKTAKARRDANAATTADRTAAGDAPKRSKQKVANQLKQKALLRPAEEGAAH